MSPLKSQPLVSVIIPAYNRAKTIEAAVKSVQAQTYTNWEIIISDDGSNDNTIEVVARLSRDDARVRYIVHHPNRGAQTARNAGIKAANGEWVAFLDSDDTWLPDSLERRLSIAEKENVPVVHSNAFIIHANNKRELQRVPALAGSVYKDVLSGEGPMFPCLLVKKTALERIGYLDESIPAYQEWDTAIRLAKLFPFGFEPEPTFVYDYRTENAISRDATRAGRGYEQIVRKHFWEIVSKAGFDSLWHHMDIAAGWYKKGNAKFSYWRCKSISIIGKYSHPKRIIRKLFNRVETKKVVT